MKTLIGTNKEGFGWLKTALEYRKIDFKVIPKDYIVVLKKKDDADQARKYLSNTDIEVTVDITF